jgi:hypothetical protein
MLVSDVLNTVRSILNDPAKASWTDADLVNFLNSFMLDLSGIRRDIYTVRAVVNLVAGSYQTLPSGGIQFLAPYVSANGQQVLLVNMADLQNARFKASMTAAASANPQFAIYDPRNRKGYRVYPASTGSASTLDILYGATPPPVSAFGDTYPLDPDTVSAAQWFVLGMAYDKSTERRSAPVSEAYIRRYSAWANANLQSEVGNLQEAP